jgi:ABC-2 type transport system ATP-binding protein
VRVPVASGAAALIDAVRALDAEHVPVADLGLRRPSLDDVFLSLTGHHAEETRPEASQPSPGRRGMIG